ncbi:unnamed protein product [Ectocarpus sp. 6 AP-2014]
MVEEVRQGNRSIPTAVCTRVGRGLWRHRRHYQPSGAWLVEVGRLTCMSLTTTTMFDG